jgi:hypothetical protein
VQSDDATEPYASAAPNGAAKGEARAAAALLKMRLHHYGDETETVQGWRLHHLCSRIFSGDGVFSAAHLGLGGGGGGRVTVQNVYLVTIFYSKLNTFRRLFGPPFTIAKGYYFPFSQMALVSLARRTLDLVAAAAGLPAEATAVPWASTGPLQLAFSGCVLSNSITDLVVDRGA